jgi:hypothetical protein
MINAKMMQQIQQILCDATLELGGPEAMTDEINRVTEVLNTANASPLVVALVVGMRAKDAVEQNILQVLVFHGYQLAKALDEPVIPYGSA